MDLSGMKIAAMTFRLRASWVHSLKEKRMIVNSLTAKLQNRFHVSAAEIDEQDTHQVNRSKRAPQCGVAPTEVASGSHCPAQCVC